MDNLADHSSILGNGILFSGFCLSFVILIGFKKGGEGKELCESGDCHSDHFHASLYVYHA